MLITLRHLWLLSGIHIILSASEEVFQTCHGGGKLSEQIDTDWAVAVEKKLCQTFV
jgi:hypothetical protein